MCCMEKLPSSPPIKRMVIYKATQYGAIAGIIATWSISTAIAASEYEIGLPISTFYSIIGIALGFNDNIVAAAYSGFGLHLLTGTILGAIVAAMTIRWKRANMLNPYKGTLIGIAAGIVVWLVFFLPITALLVQPSIPRIVTLLAVSTNHPILSDNINESFRGIAISAIVFHIIWGAIFGFIASSLLRAKAFKNQI
jgi:hypothetical protein